MQSANPDNHLFKLYELAYPAREVISGMKRSTEFFVSVMVSFTANHSCSGFEIDSIPVRYLSKMSNEFWFYLQVEDDSRPIQWMQ